MQLHWQAQQPYGIFRRKRKNNKVKRSLLWIAERVRKGRKGRIAARPGGYQQALSKISNTTVRAETDVIREVIAGIKKVIDTVISR